MPEIAADPRSRHRRPPAAPSAPGAKAGRSTNTRRQSGENVASAFVTVTVPLLETVTTASISNPAGGCRDHFTVKLVPFCVARASAAVTNGFGWGPPTANDFDFP